jgi:hypothetical protein
MKLIGGELVRDNGGAGEAQELEKHPRAFVSEQQVEESAEDVHALKAWSHGFSATTNVSSASYCEETLCFRRRSALWIGCGSPRRLDLASSGECGASGLCVCVVGGEGERRQGRTATGRERRRRG